MLSRLASRGSGFARASLLEGSNALCIAPARTIVSDAKRVSLEQRISDWENAHAMFNSPERDHKNFPVASCQDEPPPTRFLGLVPESFFKYYGSKTGVSGPYVLSAVVIGSLFAKEIIVLEHTLGELLAFIPMCLIVYYKLGPKISAFASKKRVEDEEENWYAPIKKTKGDFELAIEHLERIIWSDKGKKYLYESFHEHIDLMKEEEYRRRLNEVYTTVQRKLDYAVALETTKRTFEHKHMADWIVDKAVKSITPQQEKESIAKCIGDLKALAAANKA